MTTLYDFDDITVPYLTEPVQENHRLNMGVDLQSLFGLDVT